MYDSEKEQCRFLVQLDDSFPDIRNVVMVDGNCPNDSSLNDTRMSIAACLGEIIDPSVAKEIYIGLLNPRSKPQERRQTLGDITRYLHQLPTSHFGGSKSSVKAPAPKPGGAFECVRMMPVLTPTSQMDKPSSPVPEIIEIGSSDDSEADFEMSFVLQPKKPIEHTKKRTVQQSLLERIDQPGQLQAKKRQRPAQLTKPAEHKSLLERIDQRGRFLNKKKPKRFSADLWRPGGKKNTPQPTSTKITQFFSRA